MSHYDVLGVAPDADASTLKRAYVELARQHHPDRTGGDAARMRAVNEAWATLSDPARRARYDLSLVQPAAGAPPVATPPPPRTEQEDWWADLDDDTPIRITVAAPRWLGLVPVALFGLSIAAVVVGAVFAAPPLLGLALLLFVLSCLLFLAAPFVALFASRRGQR